MATDDLLRRIAVADVSEAAKDFYRRHLPAEDAPDGGVWKSWSDDEYLLIQELQKAGLISTKIAYVCLGPPLDSITSEQL